MKNSDIIKISTLEIVSLKLYSLIWGLLFLFKQILKYLWNKDIKVKENFGNPPEFLVGSSLGNHSYIKLKGVKFHYVESGDKINPLLILLHGFPDCWLSWRFQIPILAKYFRVIAIDLKGFGDTDKPTNINSYNIERLVDEFYDLITILGSRRCIIVGHDIGALIGWFILHIYSDLVEKFVAISSPHPNLYWSTLQNNNEFNLRWVQFCQIPMLPELKALNDDLQLLNKVYTHLNKKNNEIYLNAYKYSFSRKEDWTGAINYFRTFPYWRININEKYKVSTLLIVGNKDQNVQMESVIQSSDYLDKFSLKIINNASHFPHQESPEEVNKVLINFLVGNPSIPTPIPEKANNNGLVNRMFGAVTNTVKYGGNTVFDVVQKGTNGFTVRALSLGYDT